MWYGQINQQNIILLLLYTASFTLYMYHHKVYQEGYILNFLEDRVILLNTNYYYAAPHTIE
jgi:hypothetical protein